ncbi:MAG: glycosyltransferase family 4 protein [Parcubacteria group bacterium]|jgi:glycosyltransferase involved in cell wall biosynthesis
MKVTMVAPVPFFVDRGTPMRILEEALALEKKGVEVNIVTYHLGRNVNEINEDSKIKVYRVARLLFWYNKREAGADWQKVVLDILLIWKTSKIVFLKKPDIIHAHLHEGVLIGWIVKYLFFWRKIKLVADFHGELVSEMESHGYLNGGFVRKIFNLLEKIIFKLGDFTIASSNELMGKINRLGKVNNVGVVLDGVNIDKYKKNDFKKEENVDELKVIYSGAFVNNKGINILLEAILKISKMNLGGISFILAGGPRENIENFIKKNNLENVVKLISPLNYFDLPRVNKMGDIAIDPKTSQVGQASGKILQYMAAGLPVVCFDRENNRRYLGEAGYYVKEFDADGLVEGILYFFRNKGNIKLMSEISKKLIEKFTWESSAEEIINIYNKIKNK